MSASGRETVLTIRRSVVHCAWSSVQRTYPRRSPSKYLMFGLNGTIGP
jgi:hypothetical protein